MFRLSKLHAEHIYTSQFAWLNWTGFFPINYSMGNAKAHAWSAVTNKSLTKDDDSPFEKNGMQRNSSDKAEHKTYSLWLAQLPWEELIGCHLCPSTHGNMIEPRANVLRRPLIHSSCELSTKTSQLQAVPMAETHLVEIPPLEFHSSDEKTFSIIIKNYRITKSIETHWRKASE